MITLFCEILLSFFAVFGVFSLVRLLYLAYFSAFPTAKVLLVKKGTTAADVPQMLNFARANFSVRQGESITAIADRSLADDAALVAALCAGGAHVLFADFSD